MRELLTSELDQVCGGLMRRAIPNIQRPILPIGDQQINWSNLQINPDWWGGTSNGDADSTSINFFSPNNSGPSFHFFFHETNGIANVSVATPDVDNDTDTPLGQIPYDGPNGKYQTFGAIETWHDGPYQIDLEGGLYDADPTDQKSLDAGLRFKVSWH